MYYIDTIIVQVIYNHLLVKTTGWTHLAISARMATYYGLKRKVIM